MECLGLLDDAKTQVIELKKSSESWKSEYMRLKEIAKTSEALVKTQAVIIRYL